MAWVLVRGKDVIPIPGTTRVSHLDENLAALKLELTEAELNHIDELVPREAFAGARYSGTSPFKT